MPYDRGDHNLTQAQGSLLDAQGCACERVAALYGKIDEHSDLNAYVTYMRETAMKRAQETNERRARGAPLELDGALLAVKDNFCTANVRTTAGSAILSNFVPTYESFVTQKLLDAGAIFLGKTNMDEFGMGSSTEKGMHAPTFNPFVRSDGERVVSGGSSGGSAAVVAADLALAAIGTDTGGSIRQPSAFCGVVGFKPTYGYCSRRGIIAYASSLDQAGTITKSVADAAMLMDVIAARDPADSTSIEAQNAPFAAALKTERDKPVKLGIPIEFMDQARSETLSQIWDEIANACSKAGIEIVEVSIPSIAYSLPAYYIIAMSEASSNLARYDGMRYGMSVDDAQALDQYYELVRARGFGPEVQKRILMGTYALSSGYYDQYYLRATKVRRKLFDEFNAAAEVVDALIWPTAPTEAFAFGTDSNDPLTMYLEDVFTVPINLIGGPAISIPIANSSNNFPLAAQIVGVRHKDAQVLQIAQTLEKVIDYTPPAR